MAPRLVRILRGSGGRCTTGGARFQCTVFHESYMLINVSIDQSFFLHNMLLKCLSKLQVRKKCIIYIYIYIHPFSKRFSYREIYRQINTFVFLHVRPCAFFICYCQSCEKPRFNDNFFLRRVLCSNLKRTFRLSFFRKKHPPCNTNLQWRII